MEEEEEDDDTLSLITYHCCLLFTFVILFQSNSLFDVCGTEIERKSVHGNDEALAYTWRKGAEAPISVLVAGKPTFPYKISEYGDETVGIALSKACNVPSALSVIADTLKTRSVIVIWSNDGSRFDDISVTAEPRNTLDTFYAAIDDAKVLIYSHNMTPVMSWNADTRLTNLGQADRVSLSGKRVRGMVSLTCSPRKIASRDLRQALTEKNDATQKDNLMKFSFLLHELLEKMYDFKWDLHFSEPHAANEIYATVNGSLSYNLVKGGPFEALKTGNTDVGLFPAEQLPAGLDFMEFLLPLTEFSHPILYLEPYIVYSQFSTPAWGISAMLAFLIAVVSSLYVDSIVVNKATEELTFGTNVLNVVGAFAQQGLEETTNRLSVRMAHFSLLFLTVMLFMFYNTGLLMYTLNPSQSEIRSFGELLQSGFFIAAEDTPYNKFQLWGNYSHPDEWFYQNCRNGSCRTKVEFFNLSIGAEKVKNERVALFGYAPNIYGALEKIMTDRELSDVKEVTVHKPFLISTFVRKHFPYKELFFRGLLLLKEAGIIYHEDQTWNSEKPQPLIESYFVVASLYSTSVAFVLLFVGVFASLLLFALEMLSWRKNLAVKLDSFCSCQSVSRA